MSGQPYKTKLDISKARQAYLANLQLRAELDDKNLQANKIYVKTGQLPVEPTDTRSLTEKLADVERLKIDIRSKLLEITDGEQAGKIVESLSPDQLTFLAQNFQPIKDQMKRSYSLGVPAEAFTDYLIRYIEKFNLTRGVELGLQQSSARELLANQRTILRQMASKKDVDEILDAVEKTGFENSNLGKSIKDNLEQITIVINNLDNAFAALNSTSNAITKSEIEQLINNITGNLPSKSDIENLLKELELNRQSRDRPGTVGVLQKIDEVTTMSPDILEELRLIKEYIVEAKGATKGKPINIGEALIQLIELEDFEKITEKRDYIKVMYPYIKEGRTGVDAWARSVLDTNDSNVNVSNVNETGLNRLIQTLNSQLKAKGGVGQTVPIKEEPVKGPRIEITGTKVPETGRGIKGSGIIRIRPSQVFESDIDYSKGIAPAPKFIPIGRYLINKNQLDKDIIAIKRPAGSTIASLPSQRVSKNFGNVMRKVVGGSIPTFDELESLSDEERLYLHKVAKETRIDHKLSIPTPKKDEDEKDINQFEILKGQILAGNDNAELVKKFKTIILKLSRKDLIPKTQVKDLLLDLATLGH